MAVSTTAVQVATASATQLLTSATNSGGPRGAVSIANLGPNAIFVGTTSAVTTVTGFPIAATTGTLTLTGVDLSDGLWAIAATALQVSPADTRVAVAR